MVDLDKIKEEKEWSEQFECTDKVRRTSSPDDTTTSDEDDCEDLPTLQSPVTVLSSSNAMESNLGLLMKVFPHLDRNVLIMILKACENNLFKAMESLVQDKRMKPHLPPPIPPHIPHIQHLSQPVPMQRLPILQPLPHPRPRMLQTSGLQLTTFYPGFPGFIHGVGPHGANPLGIHPRVLETPYNVPGNKRPWCLAIPNQPFNKKPLLSRSFVSAPEHSRKTGVQNCSGCENILNIGDKFCSQCGKIIPGNVKL